MWSDLASTVWIGLPVAESLMCLATLGVALLFRPWASLRARSLHNPWLAALVLLPWLWALQRFLPADMPLQLSGACLLVLMFGWPLAIVTVLPVAATGAWLAGVDLQHGVAMAFWNGVLPATLALGLGLLTRRWLPRHLFVYILARGFFVTALASSLAGLAWLAWRPLPAGSDVATLALGHALLGWGEAFATGGLTAIFVAFVPQWLLTYSDARYLPRDRPVQR
ncbi:MAG: hypothetical protein RL375_3163 [Pseudomonadota bacterium]